MKHNIDPEDVIQSVCRSFFHRHRAGQFHVADWDSLWHLLAQITVCKCINQMERWATRKRAVHLERPLADPPAGREPSPDEAAILTETLENLMQRLPSREREILTLHLQGRDAAEIAEDVGRSRRTVRRALDHARAELCRLQVGEPTPCSSPTSSSTN